MVSKLTENDTILKLRNISILIIIFVNFFKIAESNNSFQENIFKFGLMKENNVLMSYIGEDIILKGKIIGKLSNSVLNFQKANISCDFLGRSYTGRGFSCGFSEVEDLSGYCYISLPNNIDTLLTKWECTTTAGINGDAVCKGKASVVNGNGKFAGVIGFGQIEMPLAKAILENKTENPLKLKVKIKYPLDIKKD